MPYLHPFGPDDILQNRMVTRPKFDFVMYSGSAYINNDGDFLGQNITTGTVNLSVGRDILVTDGELNVASSNAL